MTTEQTDQDHRRARCEQLLSEIVGIRSVVGEETTAHLWVSPQLREIGMSVEHYPVEGRKMPLVLGVIEGDGDGPGVLFDAHYDTVHARPERLVARPLGRRRRGRRALRPRRRRQQGHARGDARRARAGRRQRPAAQRPDLLHVRLRRRGRLPRRGADGRPRRDAARRHDLLGRGDQQHRHRDRLPGHLHLEGDGRRPHRAPDRARERHQRGDEDGQARRGRRRGPARDAARRPRTGSSRA